MNLKQIDSAIKALQLQREIQEVKESEATANQIKHLDYGTTVYDGDLRLFLLWSDGVIRAYEWDDRNLRWNATHSNANEDHHLYIIHGNLGNIK